MTQINASQTKKKLLVQWPEDARFSVPLTVRAAPRKPGMANHTILLVPESGAVVAPPESLSVES